MSIFVQFTDDSETKIQTLFCCAQDKAVLNQGEIELDDYRYAEFYAAMPDSTKMFMQAPPVISAS